VERSTSGRVWYVQRVKSDQYALRFDPLRESDAVVLGVEFEASGFERDRGTRMVVAVFTVTGRVRSRISIASFAVPTVERFSEFLKDSLT